MDRFLLCDSLAHMDTDSQVHIEAKITYIHIYSQRKQVTVLINKGLPLVAQPTSMMTSSIPPFPSSTAPAQSLLPPSPSTLPFQSPLSANPGDTKLTDKLM